jgi:hypothetical protein
MRDVSVSAATHAYGMFISQLIWYAQTCWQYGNFLDRARLLTQKLLPSATSNQQEHNNDVNNNNNLNK